jgi:hypothetical protein
MQDDEYSKSGAPILRHQPREEDWTPPDSSESSLEEIDAHIKKYIGPVETVFHEIVSDIVHVDVHFIPPTDERPVITLVTSGMSDLPMTVPEGLEEFRFAELLVSLPPEWPMSQEDFEDENAYWPVRWLKILARLPHEYDTWLGWGHSVPNGDPAEPFAPDTGFTGMILGSPVSIDPDFARLKVSEEKTIYFYALYPVYTEEMKIKLNKGAEELFARFDKNDVIDVVDLNRKNLGKRRWLPFLR